MTAPAIRGRGALSPLAGLIPRVLASITPAPMTPAAELDRLERQLTTLLQEGAPATWREQRRAFWRLTRAARREIRRNLSH